jgi:UDP-N-acetylglucosamine transferase subunit ALG13
MILVTVGTNEQPFDRLVQAAAALDLDEEVVVQYGSSAITSGRGTWVDYLDFDQLAERMRAARVVVSHAGTGSILLAHSCGRRPVVVPRRVHLGEAVDDHQLVLGRRLHERGVVTLLETEALLTHAVRTVLARPWVPGVGALPGAAALAADLRAGLELAMRSAA